MSTPSKFGFGEHQAGVDDDDVIAPAHGHAVHSELAQAAERYNVQFSSWHFKCPLIVAYECAGGPAAEPRPIN